MSNTSSRIVGLLLAAALASPPASAQVTPVAVPAPVPNQIVAARRMFISNAGSDSYGSQTYFRLTKYEGGPDRFYNQFYAAMKAWGRYELTDSPADADVVGEVRYTSPIVDKQPQYELVYDPQLNLTILDPKTRVPLWSLTEHIQPAGNKEGDNRNFDRAVSRIVDQTKMLAAGSASLSSDTRSLQTVADFAPVGAIDEARWEQRWEHVGAGSLIGAVAGGVAAWAGVHTCNGGLSCATAEEMAADRAAFNKRLMIGFGGLALGALVGWLWPTQ
jgi:hypothetical protein